MADDTPLTFAPKVTLLLYVVVRTSKLLVDDEKATLAELPTRNADFNDDNGGDADDGAALSEAGAAAVVDDVMVVEAGAEFLLSKKSPAPPLPLLLCYRHLH